MKKKLLLLSSATLTIILSLFIIGRSNISKKTIDPTPTLYQQQAENVTKAIINYGNNETADKTYPYVSGETAFSVLEKITLDKQISLETETYDFGVFVKSINGFESNADMAWIYFVNGKSGQVAADQYELLPGDTIEWKYIKPEF